MEVINWNPFFISLKLSVISTVILFFISVPITYYLVYSKNRFKWIIETIFSMPLVLPPTVLGFYFLTIFGANSFIGKILLNNFDISLVFTFKGLVTASVIFSMPFMINPIKSGMESLPRYLKEVSYTLGKSRYYTIIRVLLPNIKPSIVTGIVIF